MDILERVKGGSWRGKPKGSGRAGNSDRDNVQQYAVLEMLGVKMYWCNIRLAGCMDDLQELSQLYFIVIEIVPHSMRKLTYTPYTALRHLDCNGHIPGMQLTTR